MNENDILDKLRGPIENNLGRLKNRFLILQKMYRHEKSLFNTIFKNSMALDNLENYPDEVISINFNCQHIILQFLDSKLLGISSYFISK